MTQAPLLTLPETQLDIYRCFSISAIQSAPTLYHAVITKGGQMLQQCTANSEHSLIELSRKQIDQYYALQRPLSLAEISSEDLRQACTKALSGLSANKNTMILLLARSPKYALPMETLKHALGSRATYDVYRALSEFGRNLCDELNASIVLPETGDPFLQLIIDTFDYYQHGGIGISIQLKSAVRCALNS